jgi:hypothetical protein
MSFARILPAVLALGLCAPVAANAGALSPAAVSAVSQAGEATRVQYAPYGYYGGYYGDGGLFAIPGEIIGGAAGIIGGPIGYGGSGEAACARQFRSFDPASGTYVTYSGERVMCPYLDY